MEKITTLIDELSTIATSPRKQLDAYISQNKKVIGCMPVYCPEEIVYATGMIPFSVWGADVEVKAAKSYYPAFICSIVQTSLELGIRGSYKGLSGMMIPVLCDSLKCAGQNWKIAVKDIPFIPVIHPQNRKLEAGVIFLDSQYRKIALQLEEISGIQITNEGLIEAIKIYNDYRKTVREFLKIANDYPIIINAMTRTNILKAAGFMDKKQYIVMLQELISLLEQKQTEAWNGKKVLVSGILGDNKDLLQIFVDYKLQIVADDLAHQTRQVVTDVEIEDDAFRALAKAFANMDGCSVLYDATKGRAQKIVNYAKSNKADGVILLMTKFCDPEEYDYPFIHKALQEANIPNVTVEIDRQMESYEQIRTALQAFTEMI